MVSKTPSHDAADTDPLAPQGVAGTAAPSGVSRRGLLQVVGGVAGGAALAFGGFAAGRNSAGGASADQPFAGKHQSGITTPAQDRLHFAAFDMSSSASRENLIELLQDWSTAADRLVRGLDVTEEGAVNGPALKPPDDTGEAIDLGASGLTITIGFGPTLFRSADGVDRFGIADQQPEPLRALPHFSGDQLDPDISGGDLCIQACADDPQVAVHAIRNLSRIAFGRAALRWSQLGFGRTSSTSTAQHTPRNLFGFKDGTANIKAEDANTVDEYVWVADGDGPAWLSGGSYMVTRKIRMLIEIWDRQSLDEQEKVVGRTKGEGGPLSGGGEFTDPVFSTPGPDGRSINADSHVQLAHRTMNKGVQILRRGYNYVDGNTALGSLDAGLFFIAYQRNPVTQFVPMQRQLAGSDLLNEYISHVSSAVFAVPPGAADGGYIGQGLFEASAAK